MKFTQNTHPTRLIGTWNSQAESSWKPGFFETKLDQAKFKIIGRIFQITYVLFKNLGLYPAKIIKCVKKDSRYHWLYYSKDIKKEKDQLR